LHTQWLGLLEEETEREMANPGSPGKQLLACLCGCGGMITNEMLIPYFALLFLYAHLGRMYYGAPVVGSIYNC